MSKYKLDINKYKALARQVSAEGCVLLKNDHNALPLQKGDKVAVFGRIASDYYKSGLGSGGMVNTSYVVGILDALSAEKEITLLPKVRDIYDQFTEENPFDQGKGWGQTPWSQKEMPVCDALWEASSEANVAVVIIGRTAGEDQDNTNNPGSYLLTPDEENLIKEVCSRFERSVVILNTGNTIDMKWVAQYDPAAVLYVWQGGQEGGNGVSDVLMGRVNPSGHLTDTIARDITDYPSTPYFGDGKRNFYTEDIYVGYRYFETFAKDKVLYPFGFGLSYTTFEMSGHIEHYDKQAVTISVTVKNTGDVSGRQVAQVYVSAPQGKLGKPAKVLAGFSKTALLSPGEVETLSIIIPKETYGSFDDSGVTSFANAFLLEKGSYDFFLGDNVSSSALIGTITEEENVLLEQLSENLAPFMTFQRMKAVWNETGYTIEMEDTPLRTASQTEHREADLMALMPEIPYTGDQNIKLRDVYENKKSMKDFVAQLSDDDLIFLARGEGMCSPKVTPGTAAAFGGITDSLKSFGIPALCCSDGPSGLRMDCGAKAFSLPNGTMLGSTFDLDLVEKLYEMAGLELRMNRVDTLLGPGINIHRNPLNGRNFEYFSEDPLLTGKMAAAQLIGMEPSKTTGTIKHFATNNQEHHRRIADAVVSARALREIYLKGFEIAVKEGNCRSIMTTYGSLNDTFTAGSYDLNTRILRDEWGFDGIVMTDWWAPVNDESIEPNNANRAPMVRAQNDIYMVCSDVTDHNQDNILTQYKEDKIQRAELQRNAMNVLNFALKSVAMEYEMDSISEDELAERKAVFEESDVIPEDIVYYTVDAKTGTLTIDTSDWDTSKNTTHVVAVKGELPGLYDIFVEASSELDELAQIPVTIFMDGILKNMISFRGTNGKVIEEKRDFGILIGNHHYLKIVFGGNGLKMNHITITFREEFKFPGM